MCVCVCVCVCVYMHICVHMWRSENNVWESIFSIFLSIFRMSSMAARAFPHCDSKSALQIYSVNCVVSKIADFFITIVLWGQWGIIMIQSSHMICLCGKWALTLRKQPSHTNHPFLFVCFCCCDKILDKGNFRKEGFILAYSSRVRSIMVRKA